MRPPAPPPGLSPRELGRWMLRTGTWLSGSAAARGSLRQTSAGWEPAEPVTPERWYRELVAEPQPSRPEAAGPEAATLEPAAIEAAVMSDTTTAVQVTAPDGSRFITRDPDLPRVQQFYRADQGYSCELVTGRHNARPAEAEPEAELEAEL